MSFVRRFPVAFYLAAAFIITYLLGLGAYLILSALQDSLGTDISGINDIVLKFGPSLAGLLAIGLISGRAGLRDLFRRCVRWRFSALLYAAAILTPPLILTVALLLRGYGPQTPALDPFTSGGIFLVQVLLNTFLAGGLGEEIGWRGFMLPHLARRQSPLVASLWIAVAWFAWHAPAYLFLDKGESDPILPFVISLFAFSIVFTWGYFRSGESLLLTILLHGVINGSYYTLEALAPSVTASPGFQPAFDWIVAGIWGVIALIVLILWKNGRTQPMIPR